MKPTIGRIVIYTDNARRTWPMIINRVFEDGHVSGWVFGEYSPNMQRDVAQGDDPFQWQWPVIEGRK